MRIHFYKSLLYCLVTWYVYLGHQSNTGADSYSLPSYAYKLSGKTVFTFMKKQVTWNEASTICRTHFSSGGGKLAKIDNPEVESLIENLVGNTDVWIGLYWWFRTSHQHLEWDDEGCNKFETSGFSNFQDNQDNYDQNNRCYYLQDKTWRRQECRSMKNFVCQHQDTSTDASSCGQNQDVDVYNSVNVSFHRVLEENANHLKCKQICDNTLGCFLTSPRSKGCVVGVIDQSSTGYVRNMCYTGRQESNPPNPTPANNDKNPVRCVEVDEDSISVSQTKLDGNGIDGGGATDVIACSGDVITKSYAITKTETVTLPVVTVVTTNLVASAATDFTTVGISNYITTVTETVTLTTTKIEDAPTTTTTIAETDHNTCLFPDGTTVVSIATEYVSVTISSCLVTPCTATVTTTAMVDNMSSCDASSPITHTVCPSTTISFHTAANHQTSTETLTLSIDQSTSLNDVTSTTPPLAPSTSNNEGLCITPSNITINQEELDEVTKSIVKELIVPATSLSQQRRRKVSASDDRPTAQTSGYLAICCLTLTFAMVIVADLPALVQQINTLKRGLSIS